MGKRPSLKITKRSQSDFSEMIKHTPTTVKEPDDSESHFSD